MNSELSLSLQEQAMLALFAKYAVPPPINRWAGQAPRFAGVHEACVASVQGEIDNLAVYDRLLRATQRSDLLDVFRALRSASQDRHLPGGQRHTLIAIAGETVREPMFLQFRPPGWWRGSSST